MSDETSVVSPEYRVVVVDPSGEFDGLEVATQSIPWRGTHDRAKAMAERMKVVVAERGYPGLDYAVEVVEG